MANRLDAEWLSRWRDAGRRAAAGSASRPPSRHRVPRSATQRFIDSPTGEARPDPREGEGDRPLDVLLAVDAGVEAGGEQGGDDAVQRGPERGGEQARVLLVDGARRGAGEHRGA